MNLWIDEDATDRSDLLGGISWGSRGHADISGHFAKSDDAGGRIDIRLHFDFQLGEVDAGDRDSRFKALLFPRPMESESYSTRATFSGSYTPGDGEQLVGGWLVRPVRRYFWDSDSDSDSDDDPSRPLRVLEGTFLSTMHRPLSSPQSARLSPSSSQLDVMVKEHNTKTRWRSIIQKVILQSRGTPPLWVHLRSRRDERRTILSLFHRLLDSSISEEQMAVLREHMSRLSPEDGWFYLMRLRWAYSWARTHARYDFSSSRLVAAY